MGVTGGVDVASVCSEYTFRSPDILAPARIPVAAGKKTPKTMKNDSKPFPPGSLPSS